MKKLLLSVLSIVLVFVSCGDDNKGPQYDTNCEVCGVKSPQNNLNWLKKKIAANKVDADLTKNMFFLYTCILDGQELFLFEYLAKSSMAPHEIYDCKGNTVLITEEILRDLRDKREKWIRIYDSMK